MNIAVITPFDSSNYGAYLQAYCLKKTLEEMGHTVMHFLTRDENYVQALYYTEKPLGKVDKLMPWRFNKKQRFGKRKWKIFTEEQKEFYIVNPDDIKADLYILGSDEIWNIRKAVFQKGIFWGRSFSPVISYAASIGDANIENYVKYPELINDLNHMHVALVRDERTLSMVQKYSSVESHLVCDPTMLVPVSEYGKEIDDAYINNNDCMLIYAYSLTALQRKEICKCAKKLGLKTVSCCFFHDWCDYQCECTPLQFSSLIRKSKVVVTTTFHGTVFSILNHANFVSILTSPKTTQLLEQMDLQRRGLSSERLENKSMVEILSGSKIDYEKVEKILYRMRITSLDILKTSIEQGIRKPQKKFSYQICPYDDCTGCFACMNKCPKQAISCTVDVYGRSVPQINPQKCIKCGLCQKTCFGLKDIKKSSLRICYAAQRTGMTEGIKSASGGIGAVLTEYILQNGGSVYGAAVGRGGMVSHVRADNLKEGEKFQNSKYVQSYIDYSYRDAEKQLKSGKKVLFTGTPCQIAGLKAYLGEEYENLYCVDLICHGVPPMQYLSQHISTLVGKEKEKIKDMTFRGRKEYITLTLKGKHETIYSKDIYHDTYCTGFLNGMIHRENCFQCKYTTVERVGDLTIGDFWGLNRASLKTEQKGNISVVLVNTEKGRILFENIKNQLIYEEREIEEAVRGNHQLYRPSIMHKKRSVFLKTYQEKNDFELALKKAGIPLEMVITNVKNTMVWKILRRAKKAVFRQKRG